MTGSADADPTDQGPLRVLKIVPSAIGGTVQYSHNLANALADRGHEVVMATALDYELSQYARSYESVEVFDRFKPHIGPIRNFLKTVRRHRPQIVHFQGAQRPEFYLMLQMLLRRVASPRFVWTPQDVLSNSQKSWHMRVLRKTYAGMSHVFLNARQNLTAVHDLFGVSACRTTVLPMPDLLAFVRNDLTSSMPPEMRLDPRQPLVLCFGLIEERKGIGTVIEAFAALGKMMPDANLLIMGKSLTDVQPYVQSISNLGLQDRVQLIARYASFEEMNALFQAAHHVVMAYHTGWNSGVLAAAYGYGKPVIATRVGGFDEVVGDGTTGLLVPPKDADQLAQAMARMLQDRSAYQDMCAGAVAAGANASWASVAAQTEQVYRSVLAGAA